jgi:hypothetical protein
MPHQQPAGLLMHEMERHRAEQPFVNPRSPKAPQR